jgi:DNA-binding response OmpR family regulator
VTYVLIAEDDPDIAGVLSEGISGEFDCAADVVMNGALVPDAIAARRPDLLILDVTLPGLSGLDIFDLIRNDPQWQTMPVLFLTATPEKAKTAFATTGVHRVMAKPFDVDALLSTIRQMLRDARTTEAAA